MKTYKIDPLGKKRPLMLVRGTRLPESFPDSIAEHMAKSLKANCRGVFATINGEISSLTASYGVVMSKEANEDNNTLVVMTEGVQNQSVDWEDSTGKQFRLEHAGQFAGSLYGGHDTYYTGAYKDLRDFVTGAVPYTGQPLVAANAKQWYSYTTPEGVALTFRGCIQAPEKGGTDFVGLKIDSINFNGSDASSSFKLTLDCDSAVSLGLRNGMNDDSEPFDMRTGIGWLQIVATDDFKSHIHEFNEATGNGDASIYPYDAYDGFTYNVTLAEFRTQPGDWVIAGNNASFSIYVKSGSALEDSIIVNASGYASGSLGYDMSGSGNTFPWVEEVSPTLNAEPTVVNLTTNNRKHVVVIRFSSVQEGEQLHLDLSDTVNTFGPIFFNSMNTRMLGTESLGSGKKNFVIDIPRGDDVFAYFNVGYNAAGTLTFSRTKEEEEVVVPSQTPGFYSADGQLIKAMTKEEVEADYGINSRPSATDEAVKNATKFVWPDGVTKVGSYALSGCTGLTEVTIPSTVTTIGSQAFFNCTGLTSAIIPSTVTTIGTATFAGCTGLNPLTVPNTVTSIGMFAFKDVPKVIYGGTATGSPWGAVEVVSLSKTSGFYNSEGQLIKSMTKEEVEADYNFNSRPVAVNESVKNATKFVWPEGVTKVGSYTFSGCPGLTSVAIPEGVTTIGSQAFFNCTGLTSVTIPSTVTSVGNVAFAGCTGLTEVTIPEGVTSIGAFAFNGCTGLNPLTVPNTVNTIGNDAFKDVPKVIYGGQATGSPWGAKEVVVPSKTPGFYNAEGQLIKAMTKEEVEQDYDYNDGYPAKVNDAVKTATKFVWPDGVTRIGPCVFKNCTGLTSVTIPEGVTSIDAYAFEECSGLTSVTIPNTVTAIGDNVFYGCSGLTSITIPEGVTSIGMFAFNGCSALTSVTIPNTVTEIKDYAFNGCTSLNPLTVPNTVNTIGTAAFKDVPKVIYGGTATGSPWGAKEVVVPPPTPGFYNSEGQLVKAMTKEEVETNYSYDSYPAKNNDAVKTATKFVWPEGVARVGGYVFNGCSGLTSITIPSTVTSIGMGAFEGCSGLTSITIPNTVTEIGDNAFYGCSGLTSITIPEGVTKVSAFAFGDCTGLTSVTIPEGVTTIGEGSFGGCSGLTEVTIPNTVTAIGNSAFRSCTGLTSVTIPNTVTAIGDNAFKGCTSLNPLTVPNTVTTIGTDAFKNVPKVIYGGTATGTPWGAKEVVAPKTPGFYNSEGQLVKAMTKKEVETNYAVLSGHPAYDNDAVKNATKFVWPEGVTKLGSSVFNHCAGLTSVTIPSTVTSIGGSAFQGCTGLTSVTIPNTVTEIGVSAFQGCSGLTEVTIPSTVTSIGGSAFMNCTGLTSITIPEGVTSIDGYAFDGCKALTEVTIPEGVTTIDIGAFSGCPGLTSVEIPEGVTSIGEYAFRDCSGLTAITIPEGVTTIGNSAFESCSGLTSVTIPNTVTAIGDNAFKGCSGLTSITIPEGVTSIDNAVFYDCSGLTEVTIPSTVTAIGDDAFYRCTSLNPLTVPNTVTSIGDHAFYNVPKVIYGGTATGSPWGAKEVVAS